MIVHYNVIQNTDKVFFEAERVCDKTIKKIVKSICNFTNLF